MWHVTCDTWHVKHYIWHVTRYTQRVVNIVSKLYFSSRLWLMIFGRFGGKGSLNQWMNQSLNDKGVCRTAPATPGLLIKCIQRAATRQSLIVEAQTGRFWQQTVVCCSKREKSFFSEDVWNSGSLWPVFPPAVSRGRKLGLGDNGRCSGQTGTDQEHVGMWTFH